MSHRAPRLRAALPLLLPVLLPVLLVACGKQDTPAARGSAEGEVLPGSVSDAMLPLDTVRSQPPLAPRAEAEASGTPKREARAPAPGPAAPESPAPGSAPTPPPA